MTTQPPPDLGVDLPGDDIDARLGRLRDEFPDWRIIHTTAGWWATRSTPVSEALTPGVDLHAGTADALREVLLTAQRTAARAQSPVPESDV